MFLRVPRNLQFDYTEQLLIGRLYVLSNYGKDFVIYSNADAERDGFKKSALIYMLNSFKEKGIIEVRKKPRVIKVNLEDTSSLFLNIPIEYLNKKKIKLSSVDKIVLGRLYILYLTKGNNFFYTDKHAEELDMPLRTFKRSLAKLQELKLIEITTYISNDFRRYRTIYVDTAIESESVIYAPKQTASEIESAKSGMHLPKMTPTKSPNLTPIKSGIDTQDCPKLTLSPFINEHNINEHINEQRKNTISYPENIDECKTFFDTYIEKYADKLPLLKEVDLTSTIISFFDYYSSKNWHDANGKPVKDVYRRVVTWMGRTKLESLPKKKHKQATSYEEAVRQFNESHNFKKNEPIDVAVDVVGPEQDLDDLPF
jgi:hypothetical protein